MTLVAGALAACAVQAPAPPAEPVAAPAAVDPPAPPPDPPPADAAPSAPAAPPTLAAQQQAQKTALGAIESLEAGNEEAARRELERALALDPQNKLAQSLVRQMTVDPLATLGQESFAYVVKPGETLSRIAERFMKDLYSFYILARYNNIRIPRQLQGGQTLRIPGKAPPPAAAEPRATARTPAPPPPPPPAPPTAPPPVPTAAAPAPPPEAPAPEPPRAAPAAPDPSVAQRAEVERKQRIETHTRSARAAFAKQDLEGAIRNWDAVLALDPGNGTATFERQRVVALKEKLGKVK